MYYNISIFVFTHNPKMSIVTMIFLLMKCDSAYETQDHKHCAEHWV